MKKQIVISLLCLNMLASVHADKKMQFDVNEFVNDVNSAGNVNDDYMPNQKPLLTSLAMTCAEHMPDRIKEALFTGLCAAYCKYDEMSDWAATTVSPKVQAFIDRYLGWLYTKKLMNNAHK